jgi:hypothetical protein
MITDEELIERLRSSMNAAAAHVFPPVKLLDGISPARKIGFRPPAAGGVAAMLATAFAVVIALVAITSLRHTRTPAAPTLAPQTRPAPGANSLATLRSELAILRRPQRVADKLPGWGIAAEQREQCSNCLNLAKLIPTETRLLARVRLPSSHTGYGRGPERIYLVLGTVPSSWGNGRISGWRQHGRAIRGLHLSLVGLTGRSHIAQPMDQLLNYAVNVPVPAELLSPRAVIITSFATIGVVPDGVTRVKWELDNPGQTKPIAVYPRVHGNVAVAPWTPAPRSTALINEQLLVGATWYGADGHTIAGFSDSLARLNKAYSP